MSGWDLTARVCCFMLLLQFGLPVAEAVDSTGSHFILGFMGDRNNVTSYDVELVITTNSADNVTVNVTTPLYDPALVRSVVVNKDHSAIVTLPAGLRGSGTELSNKGIYVVAEGKISVFGHNKQDKAADTYLGLPQEALGTEHMAITYLGEPELLVVGTEDGTMVNVTFPTSYSFSVQYGGITYGAGSTLSVHLQNFETLQLLGRNNTDLTGVRVTSDKPVAFYSGNRATLIEVAPGLYDEGYLVEMIPPRDFWGTLYSTTHTPFRRRGDLFRFVAWEDNTTVHLGDGTTQFLPWAGDVWELDIPDGEYLAVVSDKPILVAMLSKSVDIISENTTNGEPSLTVIPPENMYKTIFNWATIQTEQGKDFTNMLAVIINKDYVSGLKLDGQSGLTWNSIDNITGSHNVHLWMKVEPGSHILTHRIPVLTFFAFVSGVQDLTSYSSPAGYGSGSTYTCMVKGDPHLTMLNGQTASLAIPCSYHVTRLRVTNVIYAPEEPFYPEIEMIVHGGNSQRPMNGRYYVSDIYVMIAFRNGTDQGPSNTYYTGELLLNTGQSWRILFHETMQGRVVLSYDAAIRLATLRITHTSLVVSYTLPDRSQGNFQTIKPGISVEVSTSDLIYNETVRFPETLCSTVDDTDSISVHAQEHDILPMHMGIFAVLAHMTYNILEGDQDPKCASMMGKFSMCETQKKAAFKQCLIMLRQPGIINCMENHYHSSPCMIDAVIECLDNICLEGYLDCSKLRNFTAVCPEMYNTMKICPAAP